MAASKFISPPPLSERISKEEEFFNKDFLMSYSGLNKLMYSPALFYRHYILNQKDDSYDQNMVEGSLIHCLLLDKENFDTNFILSPDDTPSDSQRDVLHSLYEHYKVLKNDDALEGRENLEEFSPAVLDLLEDRNLYQSMKESTRLGKMINDTTNSYWEYLKKSEGKTIIDHETHEFAKGVVNKITSNAIVMERMGFFGDDYNGITSTNENEFIIPFEETELNFGLRGFIDNLVFDPEQKVIRINDLKKTSKTISKFTDSIEYFNYWAQAAMYSMLVAHNYRELSDWAIEFRFIVIDAQMQIAPIKVSTETMIEWQERLTNALQEASFHFAERNFELPYEFLANKEIII